MSTLTANNPGFNDDEDVTSLLSILLMVGIALLLVVLSRNPELASLAPKVDAASADLASNPKARATAAREKEIAKRFQEAVVMLHAKKYNFAITALHRVIELSPRMPEAYVNMGYALLGMKRYKQATFFFNTAINLRPYQGNAYWGLAVSLEGMKDLQGALGAMRTYIHLAPSDPNSQDYVRRARAAIWEWENTLKRGPLPPEEDKFLTERGKEWAERNSPEHDAPENPGHQALQIHPTQ